MFEHKNCTGIIEFHNLAAAIVNEQSPSVSYDLHTGLLDNSSLIDRKLHPVPLDGLIASNYIYIVAGDLFGVSVFATSNAIHRGFEGNWQTKGTIHVIRSRNLSATKRLVCVFMIYIHLIAVTLS